jgi:multicomponent Na+:H+ antiporter subunit E
MRVFLTLLLIAATWLLWSGMTKPLLLGLGALSSLLVLWLAVRMQFFHRDVFFLHLLFKLPGYWGWLFVEAVKSNLHVARIVLSPRLRISPTTVQIQAISKTPVGQVLLANSITLTPGTVTLDVDEGVLTVHCLTREGAEELLRGEMNRRSARAAGD